MNVSQNTLWLTPHNTTSGPSHTMSMYQNALYGSLQYNEWLITGTTAQRSELSTFADDTCSENTPVYITGDSDNTVLC